MPGWCRATDFRYDQNVQAAYGLYAFGIGKNFTTSFGSRLEHTAVRADFGTPGGSFERAYLNLLPIASAEYSLGATSSLRAAYSRRITRPCIDYLNPFVNTSSAGNIFYVNPALDPELMDSYELGYSTTLVGALSVRHRASAVAYS